MKKNTYVCCLQVYAFRHIIKTISKVGKIQLMGKSATQYITQRNDIQSAFQYDEINHKLV